MIFWGKMFLFLFFFFSLVSLVLFSFSSLSLLLFSLSLFLAWKLGESVPRSDDVRVAETSYPCAAVRHLPPLNRRGGSGTPPGPHCWGSNREGLAQTRPALLSLRRGSPGVGPNEPKTGKVPSPHGWGSLSLSTPIESQVKTENVTPQR